jgi:hypothetical protein
LSPRPSFAERIALLHRALEGAGIEHGFGGAVALAYHVQEPRATRDIDVNVSVDPARADEVLRALPAGIAIPPEGATEVLRNGQIRLWWDGDLPADLFFPQHAFHAEVRRDTLRVPFLAGTIPIISATHLTVFKALFDRSRDWPDIEAMLLAGTVDGPVALDWLRRLMGTGSASYQRLAALIDTVGVGGSPGPGDEMVRPPVDWDALGS